MGSYYLEEGRYTEFIMRDGLNDETGIVWGQLDPDFGGPRTNTITIEPTLMRRSSLMVRYQ